MSSKVNWSLLWLAATLEFCRLFSVVVVVGFRVGVGVRVGVLAVRSSKMRESSAGGGGRRIGSLVAAEVDDRSGGGATDGVIGAI